MVWGLGSKLSLKKIRQSRDPAWPSKLDFTEGAPSKAGPTLRKCNATTFSPGRDFRTRLGIIEQQDASLLEQWRGSLQHVGPDQGLLVSDLAHGQEGCCGKGWKGGGLGGCG